MCGGVPSYIDIGMMYSKMLSKESLALQVTAAEI